MNISYYFGFYFLSLGTATVTGMVAHYGMDYELPVRDVLVITGFYVLAFICGVVGDITSKRRSQP